MGLTNLVYHGADHTRFAHSIGVMELATKVFHEIITKDKTGDKIIKWKKSKQEKNLVLLRLVALLHDIGHAPFSHASDTLFPTKQSHETFSARIVTEYKEIKDIINNSIKSEFRITPQEIANFILNKEADPILQAIINGPLDADKMDYLWRDSYYTGVTCGLFDLDRLVNTLIIVYDRVRKGPSVGIEEGGVYVAEGLILARYYMFLQVYFHKIRRAFDLHLSDFLVQILPNKRYPIDIERYITYDDPWVLTKISQQVSKNGKHRRLAEILFNRKNYKTLWQTSLYTGPKEKEVFDENRNELKDKFTDVDFKTDGAGDAPNKFKKEIFYVKKKHHRAQSFKDKYSEIDNESTMIKNLIEFNIFRAYVPRDRFQEVEEYSRKNLKWKP